MHKRGKTQNSSDAVDITTALNHQKRIMSLNNSRFSYYIYLFYPNEHEISDTTYIQKFSFCLDIENG